MIIDVYVDRTQYDDTDGAADYKATKDFGEKYKLTLALTLVTVNKTVINKGC